MLVSHSLRLVSSFSFVSAALYSQSTEPLPTLPSRLNKMMSHFQICSRLEADLMIKNGWVLLDQQAVTWPPPPILSPISRASISLTPEGHAYLAAQATILLNKPPGVVSAQPEPLQTPAIRLITAEAQFPPSPSPTATPSPRFDPSAHLPGLVCAGRLDLDSRGLLVLTQSGRVAHALLSQSVDKEYLVTTRERPADAQLQRLASGRIVLDGKPVLPAPVARHGACSFRVVLREGRNRQIRRMCGMVQLTVVDLVRIRIGKVALEDLPEGRWRFLQNDETF